MVNLREAKVGYLKQSKLSFGINLFEIYFLKNIDLKLNSSLGNILDRNILFYNNSI